MTNRLMMIQPYWNGATWCFDDPKYGIVAEPFVAGAPEILDRLLDKAGLPAREKFALIFSDQPFPGYMLELAWEREEFGGNWYRTNSFPSMEGWLCPVLQVYFPAPPMLLYCEAKVIREGTGTGPW